ncbi:hypothetical protein R3P38DRAFT_3383766 [Favolaschia claudopus]|uniref:DUF6593 domain-containing protein n=1 Tax=Favolaschia claudopus TaxID=2862362 RepID=A0AAW0E7V7_9AGAR
MDTVLRFSYSKPEEIRTFGAHKRLDGGGELQLYEVSCTVPESRFLISRKFYHSSYGPSTGVTTFQRKNLRTDVWEPAGEISWTSSTNATVHFGTDEVRKRCVREFRQNDGHGIEQRSRRFKAGGSEYKWKTGEGNDLFCVDSRGKTVATWTQELTTLWVGAPAERILDRVVVTCLLNLWVRQLGHW